MIDFLLSVPGRCAKILEGVNELKSSWSPAKSALIDTSISSRAPSSTALSTNVWTSTRAAALDGVEAINSNVISLQSNPVLDSPSSLSLVGVSVNTATRNALGGVRGLRQSASSPTSAGTWTAIINENGRGVIDFLAITVQNPGGGSASCRLTIDGQSATLLLSGSGQRSGILIGALGVAGASGSEVPAGIAFEQLPFHTQFKLEVNPTQTGWSFLAYHKYRRTG